MPSQLEMLMWIQIKAWNLQNLCFREHLFHDDRQWRFDYAWPYQRVALEVEGGSWKFGRHVRGKGFEDDCEKYNAAVVDGWKVLRVTGRMVQDGRAIKTLIKLLGGGENHEGKTSGNLRLHRRPGGAPPEGENDIRGVATERGEAGKRVCRTKR